MTTMQLWSGLATQLDPASAISQPKRNALHDAVINACDAKYGVKDGILENPAACQVDPRELACTAGDSGACLTEAQVAAARKIYAGPVNPRTKQSIFPGLARGSEANWDNTNLKAFFDRGGKLLIYHGWNDPAISPFNSINYYTGVLRTTRSTPKAEDSVRLFMMPGVNHCGGGAGTDTWDKVAVLDAWRTTGKAPTQVVASHLTEGKVDKTRPLCAYPQVATYKGSGDTNTAANFVCK